MDGDVVDLDLVAVEDVVVSLYLLRQGVIALRQGADGAGHGALGMAGHGEQLVLQDLEFFVEVGHGGMA
ncbi:hypothetical protein D3C83_91010 [compost metagenome]